MRGMDVSSYQPRDLTALIASTGARHVVVRMYLPGETPSRDHSRAQVASARANGCSVGAIVWGYGSFDPVHTVLDALMLASSVGLTPEVLWIDCETYMGAELDMGPDAAWLRSAVAQCKRQGVRAGIYSGLWWLQDYLTDWSEFTHLPLWLAQYDGNPTLDDVVLPAGWDPAMLWGKQFLGDSPVDLDVFRVEATLCRNLPWLVVVAGGPDG